MASFVVQQLNHLERFFFLAKPGMEYTINLYQEVTGRSFAQELELWLAVQYFPSFAKCEMNFIFWMAASFENYVLHRRYVCDLSTEDKVL